MYIFYQWNMGFIIEIYMVKKIEDYTLIECIGGGSYGEVFKASNANKPGLFAIKVIPNKLLDENPKV